MRVGWLLNLEYSELSNNTLTDFITNSLEYIVELSFWENFTRSRRCTVLRAPRAAPLLSLRGPTPCTSSSFRTHLRRLQLPRRGAAAQAHSHGGHLRLLFRCARPHCRRPARSPSPPSLTAARPLSPAPPTSSPGSPARRRAWAVPEATAASKDRANLRRLLLDRVLQPRLAAASAPTAISFSKVPGGGAGSMLRYWRCSLYGRCATPAPLGHCFCAN